MSESSDQMPQPWFVCGVAGGVVVTARFGGAGQLREMRLFGNGRLSWHQAKRLADDFVRANKALIADALRLGAGAMALGPLNAANDLVADPA